MKGVDGHIVDVLISERAKHLSASRFWPIMRPVLYPMLYYKKAMAMADQIREMNGHDAVSTVSQLLDLNLVISGQGHIPKTGGFILAANHPTGIADGIAVWDALSPIRPDMAIFTNRDALRVCEGLRDILIPVEWAEDKKSHAKARDMLRQTSNAFEQGRAVVLFPSGRLAAWDKKKKALQERPWQPTLITLARKYDVPIIPLKMTARNSPFFYFLSGMSNELRDITLFHELLNKKDSHWRLEFGSPIAPEILSGDPRQEVARLQALCTA